MPISGRLVRSRSPPQPKTVTNARLGREGADVAQHSTKSVGRVGVVHDHDLVAIAHHFKTTGDVRDLCASRRAMSLSLAPRRLRMVMAIRRVIDVEVANEWRIDQLLPPEEGRAEEGRCHLRRVTSMNLAHAQRDGRRKLLAVGIVAPDDGTLGVLGREELRLRRRNTLASSRDSRGGRGSDS
jgi:hypothetical protein